MPSGMREIESTWIHPIHSPKITMRMPIGIVLSMKWKSYEHEYRCEGEKVDNSKIDPLFIEEKIRHKRDQEGCERENNESSDRGSENLIEWSLLSGEKK